MDKKTTDILEKLLERKIENKEKERLQRIQDTLRIGPNDALWAIIAAMEYPRIYYENYRRKSAPPHPEFLRTLPTLRKKRSRSRKVVWRKA